jgi:hypothetical protein
MAQRVGALSKTVSSLLDAAYRFARRTEGTESAA